MPANAPLLGVAAIAVIGVLTIFLRKNVIKVIMGIALLEAAVNLFLVCLGYREGGIAPIFTNAPPGVMVLPTVQALTLTAIVIGLATLALLLSFAVLIHRKYGTLDIQSIKRLKG